jgi:hypothetical protein
MKFKDVEFTKVPAFLQFCNRLRALRSAYIPEKAGYEFDVEIFRIYVQKPNTIKIPVDIYARLLRDLDQNPRGRESDYTKELVSKLDELIVAAIPERDRP